MSADTMTAPFAQKPSIGQIASFLTVATMLIGLLFWVFNVNAKADSALKQGDANAELIQKKADKDDMKTELHEINKKLDLVLDRLMNEPAPAR
jgi:hypothetical protein